MLTWVGKAAWLQVQAASSWRHILYNVLVTAQPVAPKEEEVLHKTAHVLTSEHKNQQDT
jgi:hypothetical protein